MDISELHFGQTIYFHNLDRTGNTMGYNDELGKLINQPVSLVEFDGDYGEFVQIQHPLSGSFYYVHKDDLSLSPFKDKADDKIKIIRMTGDKTVFDEEELFL